MKKPSAEQALRKAVQQVGGTLTFDVVSTADGWYAECKEIDSILTGGVNPHPTEEEVFAQIQDALAAVFNPCDVNTSLPKLTVSSMQFRLPAAALV